MKTIDKTNPPPYKTENDNQELWLTNLEVYYEAIAGMICVLPYRNI